MESSTPLLNVLDYEARASEIIPSALFNRWFGTYGAPDWITNTNNLDAIQATKLRPRVLAGIGKRELSTRVLGQDITLPVMLAPSGFHQRAHPDGELASVRAAGSMGTVMCLSTASTYSIEEVAQASSGPIWFQLYFLRQREVTETLVRRAEDAGYTALVITVDNLPARSRERDTRYAYQVPAERVLKNFEGTDLWDSPTRYAMHDSYEMAIAWSDMEWLRTITSMPMVIKGIQTAEDARLCVEHGMDGLIVSNHGGHSLEGSTGSMEILPEIVDAVGGGTEVYMDGGVRRGADVVKALALGARAVFIGRPIFWGLAIDGEVGVRHVLEIFRDELDIAMGLCGVASAADVDRDVAVPAGVGAGDPVDRLERLAGLVDRGYLTRQEFDAQKARILGS
jgi:isopentenyl diphosphate isomerase/L-lactate dehydrogenase-like FMN-dependent dehydrogenase